MNKVLGKALNFNVNMSCFWDWNLTSDFFDHSSSCSPVSPITPKGSLTENRIEFINDFRRQDDRLVIDRVTLSKKLHAFDIILNNKSLNNLIRIKQKPSPREQFRALEESGNFFVYFQVNAVNQRGQHEELAHEAKLHMKTPEFNDEFVKKAPTFTLNYTEPPAPPPKAHTVTQFSFNRTSKMYSPNRLDPREHEEFFKELRESIINSVLNLGTFESLSWVPPSANLE